MKIEILQLLDGASRATGLTVVIDVFRAFSMACYLFENGAEAVYPVQKVEEAFSLQQKLNHPILIGERNERPIPGFHFGNSPTHILNHSFAGKSVIHTTSAGTQGLLRATGAQQRLTGSFVNAPAIIEYIQHKKPEKVSLVCMGYSLLHPTEEDTLCAAYIYAGLKGLPFNLHQAIQTIRNSSGKRLFAPENQPHSPATDFYLCLATGWFPYVLTVDESPLGPVLSVVDPKTGARVTR